MTNHLQSGFKRIARTRGSVFAGLCAVLLLLLPARAGAVTFFAAEVRAGIPDSDGIFELRWERPPYESGTAFIFEHRPDGSTVQLTRYGTSPYLTPSHSQPGVYFYTVMYGWIASSGRIQVTSQSSNYPTAFYGTRPVTLEDLDGNSKVGIWWDVDGAQVYQRWLSEVSSDGQPFFDAGARHSMKVTYDKKDKPWSFFAAHLYGQSVDAFDTLRMRVRGNGFFLVKLEDTAGNGYERTLATTTADPNDWETLVFDYRPAQGFVNLSSVNNLLFFVAPGQVNAKGTFYLDNLAFENQALNASLPPSPTVSALPAQVNVPYPYTQVGVPISGTGVPGQLITPIVEIPGLGQWNQPSVTVGASGTWSGGVNLAGPNRHLRVWAVARNPNSGYESLPSVKQTILFGQLNLSAPKLDTLPWETAYNAVPIRGVAKPYSWVYPSVMITGVGRWDQNGVQARADGCFEAVAYIYGASGQSFELFAYFVDAGNYSAESPHQTVTLRY